MESSQRISENIFSNGDVYYGNFSGMLPNGYGKYTWLDGKVYEGDWEEGKMTGKGKVIWPSGATYEGDFIGGYLVGFGTLTGLDGSVYVGSWSLNIQHGIGEKQYQNSDFYEGTWKEGVHEGSGRYIWSNGNMYIGTWKSGKMCGRGVLKWLNGDLFDGFWSNGLRHGLGFYSFADGSYYMGTWTKGLNDGRGRFFPAGSKRPSLKKWCSFELHKEKIEGVVSAGRSLINLEQRRVTKPNIIQGLSRKISLTGILRRSSRIPRKIISLEKDWSLSESGRKVASCDMSCMLDHTFDEDQSEMQDKSSVVYEREYVQGVMIKERITNIAGLSKKSRPRCKAKEVKVEPRVNMSEGIESYCLMLNLQLGIRFTVGKIASVAMREVQFSDFEGARIRMYFPRKGSQVTPSHYSLDFHWTDYCPTVFRNLREMFKLDAADYMMSICCDDGLREISSSGKSGSIFYLSQDDRFVIKTLRRSELKVLLKMIPSYYAHVKDHENTLITKFFGVHRITPKGGKKVRFVVMGNMFCTELRIHRRYDLKGSWQGRFTNEKDIVETTTLKDLDLSYEFHMDKLLRDTLFKQISLDCMFLESQQIIDYSLLLGLHFRAPQHQKALLESSHMPESISAAGDGAIAQEESLIRQKGGLLLVTHEPNIVSTTACPHIRGSPLRASSVGDAEVDLLLPGTGRLRIQLGVNMPAQANHKLLDRKNVDSAEVELFEVYDVVIYLGVIDILQDYYLKKKLEHTYKSREFDPPCLFLPLNPSYTRNVS